MSQQKLWVCGLGLLVAASVGLSGLGRQAPVGISKAQPPALTETVLPAKGLLRDADQIRVGLSDDAMTELEYTGATMSATGPFEVTRKLSGEVVYQGAAQQLVRIRRDKSGFWLNVVNGASLGPYAETLVVRATTPEGRLKLPSVTRKGIIPHYRGIFELTPGYSGVTKFTVVNVLPMQDYLKAVVPNELPFSYGYEAVKAQAVAARNYAIHPREKPWPQFDICDSQYCQAYYGSNTEHPQTTKALEQTQGLIALYSGEPILALYSSSHGGHSENYENAFSDPQTNRFPGTPIPYLRGKADRGLALDLSKEDAARRFYLDKTAPSYDIFSPHYRWEKQWTRSELESVINENLAVTSKEKFTAPFIQPSFATGSRIGTLKSLRVDQRGVSGKIMRLAIEGSNGTWTIDKEFVIRKVLKHNGKFLPSANLVFEQTRDQAGHLLAVKAYGGGFGHGVGMSQLGASYLSKQGRSFVNILQHYYDGVSVGTIPLTADANNGMKTQFFAPEPHGMLYVKAEEAQTVRLAINGQMVMLASKGPSILSHDVSMYLHPGQLNEFSLLALEGKPGATVKAWIEVQQPHTSLAHSR